MTFGRRELCILAGCLPAAAMADPAWAGACGTVFDCAQQNPGDARLLLAALALVLGVVCAVAGDRPPMAPPPR